MTEITPEQLADTQHRVSVLSEVTQALKDSSKVLSDSTIRGLLHFAEKTAFASDATMPFSVVSQHHENGRLKDQVVTIWNRQLALQQDLDHLRKYLGFATADALKVAVDAGVVKPVAVPVAKPAVYIDVKTAADKAKRDHAIAQAQERAKEAQAAAAAVKAAQEKEGQ